MYRNREDAGRQLADRLRDREFVEPLVLAIPRGGVVIGAIVARELGADLDVVLSRKLRAPNQPELAIGAISEAGEVHLNHHAEEALGIDAEYVGAERRRQLAEIARRKKLFRAVRPPAQLAGRSVLVTDDGIATGSTMIAALQVARAQNPRELLVTVPVASPDRVGEIERHCDEVVCLLLPESFWAIGQFYQDFTQLDDQDVVKILREFAPANRGAQVLQRSGNPRLGLGLEDRK